MVLPSVADQVLLLSGWVTVMAKFWSVCGEQRRVKVALPRAAEA